MQLLLSMTVIVIGLCVAKTWKWRYYGLARQKRGEDERNTKRSRKVRKQEGKGAHMKRKTE